jgi:hypothetical protein
MLINVPQTVTPANQRRRELLLQSPPPLLDRTVYHYRHHASSGVMYLDLDYFFVPIGGGLYAGYGFKQYASTSIRTLGTINEYRPGLWTAASSGTLAGSGSWSTTPDNSVFVAGTPDAGGGNYRSNATSGGTATFSGSYMTGNTIVLVITAFTNNGYATVSLNGNDTGAANRLPVITSSMIQANGGNFLDADLGKTYIDFYAGAFCGDEHVCIAENLDEDTEHSLVITVRGAKGTTASTGNSVRISGVIACRRDSVPTTASHRMARVRKVNDLNDALSAIPCVIGWAADSNSANNRLMGENHVGTDVGIAIAENGVSHVITNAAGSVITPVRGTYATSTAFYVNRVTTLTRAAVSICTKNCTFSFNPAEPQHCMIAGSVNFLTAGYLHNSFFGMLPAFQARSIYGTTFEKTDFNRGLLGDRVITNVEWTSGGSIEYRAKVDTLAWFSTAHDTVWLMHMPRPDLNVDNWAHSADMHSFLRAVANVVSPGLPPGGLKGYFTRISTSDASADPQSLPAGSIINFEVGYRLMRIAQAATVLSAN